MSLQGYGVTLVLDRDIRLGDMQRQLCSAFSKHFPFSQVGVVIGERVFVDFLERPLLHVADKEKVDVVWTRTTDMTHIDVCFRGPRPSFEEDMREPTETDS